MSKKFVLFGNGKQAQVHKKAIASIGGTVLGVYSPLEISSVSNREILEANYAVIASPNYLHYNQTLYALSLGLEVIVEKPSRLPWEPMIDDDRVNISLPLNYLECLVCDIDKVKVVMSRNDEYFDSWRGDFRKSGGAFFNLFIHYIDLAIQAKVGFDGAVNPAGKQMRRMGSYDLMNIDYNVLYSKMYEDIVFKGKGIKPRDKFFLDWIMNKYCTGNRRYGTLMIDRESLAW